jgi:HEPN domain-containing protein
VSLPVLVGLACGFGALAIWYFRAKAARSSARNAAGKKVRNAAVRSAQSVEAALKGRR